MTVVPAQFLAFLGAVAALVVFAFVAVANDPKDSRVAYVRATARATADAKAAADATSASQKAAKAVADTPKDPPKRTVVRATVAKAALAEKSAQHRAAASAVAGLNAKTVADNASGSPYWAWFGFLALLALHFVSRPC
jgi:cytoskeletal protein RodZ